MSYVAPHTFFDSTPLTDTGIQENADALKNYINGGVVAGDVSAAAWVRAPHIMRGTYIPLQNLHEFATGVVRGSTYQQGDVTMSADKFRTPTPAYSGDKNLAQVTEFVPEELNYTQRIGYHIHPKHPPVSPSPSALSSATTQVSQTTLGDKYTHYTCEETDAGVFADDALNFGNGIAGFYRRRPIQNWEIQNVNGASIGLTHTLRWYAGTNNIVNDFTQFGYNLEIFYE